MTGAKSKVEDIIAGHHVVIFSKTYCSYSKAAKSLLNEQGIPFYALELDQLVSTAYLVFSHLRGVANIKLMPKHIGDHVLITTPRLRARGGNRR
ncbi:predicted protein [Histoplasma mississippiense (nom. inval.)]|uniref:predicted protein n=1 Tax=Ajellomyces capsulatus (strain NAm1 / WU24) TaxID=2059318 RepID=UPI000157B2B1|nr:predicted protein [Histoplasma mississippiense (nom. inval.)]EDN02282.1 predicted protein [Histoplasma mississippiense (nom. inval.)]